MYNLYENPKELRDARTIRHLTDSLIEILMYTRDKKLADFIYNRLLATLHPVKDEAIIKKINNLYESFN